MKPSSPITTFAKKHKLLMLLAIILFTLPFSVSLIQWVIPYRFIVMTPAEFVLFYGTAGSILWGVCAYVLQRADRKREKEEALVPDLVVDVVKAEQSFFEVEITNAGLYGVKNLCVFDQKIASFLPSEESLSISLWTAHGFEIFSAGINALAGIDFDCDFDGKGYPAHITVTCEDLINRSWAIYFERSYSSGQYSYNSDGAEWVCG